MPAAGECPIQVYIMYIHIHNNNVHIGHVCVYINVYTRHTVYWSIHTVHVDVLKYTSHIGVMLTFTVSCVLPRASLHCGTESHREVRVTDCCETA